MLVSLKVNNILKSASYNTIYEIKFIIIYFIIKNTILRFSLIQFKKGFRSLVLFNIEDFSLDMTETDCGATGKSADRIVEEMSLKQFPTPK